MNVTDVVIFNEDAMDHMYYATSCAIADAFKSLWHYRTVTAMRVVGLALFVAGLFVVARLATSIYTDATESQDQTTLRGVKISVGIDADCFTDECLESLRQISEIEHIERLYTILPKLQYQGSMMVAILESASSENALFGKERMRVGHGPQKSNETTLTKPLADRLGIKEEDVKKNDVKILATQERTRSGVKESSERQFNVVGICRGTNEAGYILESDAATMNAWATGALTSMDGKKDSSVRRAFVFLKEVSPELEEYAKRNKLAYRKRGVLKMPKLKSSTWARVDPEKIDANSYMECPTYVFNAPNDTFIILTDADQRLANREDVPIFSETKNDDSRLNSTIFQKISDARRVAIKEDLTSEDNSYGNRDFSPKRFTETRYLSHEGGESYSDHYGQTQEERFRKKENREQEFSYLPPRYSPKENETNVALLDKWKRSVVKKDCDVSQTFGFMPECGKSIRIVTLTESKSILLENNKTLADVLRKNVNPEEKHIFLEANVKENEEFYRRAYCRNAILPFTEQELEEIQILEFEATDETPEETAKGLLNDLRTFRPSFVKEKVETEGTIKGVAIRLIGSQKNDLENKLRLVKIDETEDWKGLELSVQDAKALGASEWKRGDEIPICFTRKLGFGKEERIVLKFPFLGVNTVTKIPIDDLKNIVAWQKNELAYDEREAGFVDLALQESSKGSYSARVLAKSTEDAAKLASKLTTLGYTITDSGVDKIEGTKRLLRNLTSFVLLFNISGLALCLLNIITTDFLVIRLRKSDVAAMIDLGVDRICLFKEIFAETLITSLLALTTVVGVVLTVGKPLAQSLLALTGVTLSEFKLFDYTGVKILLAAGVLTLTLASLAQISTVIFLASYKRPTFLRK